MNYWPIEVARISILLCEKDRPYLFQLPHTYLPFLNKKVGSVDCEIRLHVGCPTFTIKKIYASSHLWSVFIWGNGWGFVTPSTKGQPWRRVILWNPQTGRADIWLRDYEARYNILGNLHLCFPAALFAHYHTSLSHAAAVKVGEYSWLFVGKSGYGKSTWAQLCQERGYTVLDEDRVALRLFDGQVWVFGTPWHPEPRLCSPEGAPVRRIFFLRQAKDDTLCEISHTSAAIRLLSSFSMPFYNPQAIQILLSIAAHTTVQAENYLLGYAHDERLLDYVFSM